LFVASICQRLSSCKQGPLWLRALKVEERVRPRASSREICGGQRDTGTRLPTVT